MGPYSVFADSDLLAQAAALYILEVGKQAIARYGAFTFALAGGSTPRDAYKGLSQMSSELDWSAVHLFWGDERCLPADDPRSNYRMAWDAFISRVPLPIGNIHRIYGELPPREAAGHYQQDIAKFFEMHPERIWQSAGKVAFPSFDLIILGMGDDGHTASLFPGSPALDESERWVVGVEHNRPPPPLVDRVTFTLPLINAAADVVFLVTGENKAERLLQVFKDDAEPALPAQRVKPVSGRLSWLLDSRAGLMLQDDAIDP